MCIVLYLHVCLCTMCTTGAHEGQKRVLGFPRTGVSDDCEPPCGFLESNPGPLQITKCSKFLSHLSALLSLCVIF